MKGYNEFKTFLDDGGGGGLSGIPTSLISIFESYNFLFHSFLRLLRAYMPMRVKREIHRLSGYLIEGAVWGSPSTQNLFLFLFLLPSSPLSASTLNRQLPEYRSLSISELLQPIPIISKLTRFVICSVLAR